MAKYTSYEPIYRRMMLDFEHSVLQENNSSPLHLRKKVGTIKKMVKRLNRGEAYHLMFYAHHAHTEAAGGTAVLKNHSNDNDAVYQSVMTEYGWLISEDKHVLYPQDIGLLKGLADSHFELEGLAVDFPYKSFILNFPKDMLFNGRVPTSVVVHIASPREMVDDLVPSMYKEASMEMGGMRITVHDSNKNQNTPMVHIGYVEPSNSGAAVHTQFRLSTIVDLLSESPEAFYERYSAQTNFDDDDIWYLRELWRVVAGLIIYIQTFGDDVIFNGLPKDTKMPLGDYNREFAKPKVIGSPKSLPKNSSGKPRTWHLRVLRHQKYYQKEHAHKKRGSRIIYVTGQDVHDITPHTVIKKKGKKNG